MMDQHRHLPETDRLSTLTATIMLAYALTPFIKFPEQVISINLFGIIFSYRYTFTTVVTILVAVLAAVGTIYLLQTHPQVRSREIWQHSLLPALTAWAIGIPLSAIQVSPEWWGVFFLAGALLTLVFVTEFIVVDPDDTLYPVASVAITALSFALYFILVTGSREGMLRIYLLIPTVGITMLMVSLRTLHLRFGNRWDLVWSLAIALTIGGLAIGLHYLPLSPIKFGLLLLGVAYGLTSLAGNLIEGRQGFSQWVEPGLVTLVLWLFALFLG